MKGLQGLPVQMTSPRDAQSKPESLEALAEHVLECARALFYLNQYWPALAAFTHCLALRESTAEPTVEYIEWRGAMLHNIATCFHHLGVLDAALVYYEYAAADFGNSASDVNRARIAFVKERLVAVADKRMPRTDTYLDSDGYRRSVNVDATAAAAVIAECADLCGGTARALLNSVPNALCERVDWCTADGFLRPEPDRCTVPGVSPTSLHAVSGL